MPGNHPSARNCQGQTKQKPQHKFRMSELFEAMLYGQPRIAFWIYATADPVLVLCQLFCRVGAEGDLRQQTDNHKDRDYDDPMRPMRSQRDFRWSRSDDFYSAQGNDL
jgi:hypothetical protein